MTSIRILIHIYFFFFRGCGKVDNRVFFIEEMICSKDVDALVIIRQF